MNELGIKKKLGSVESIKMENGLQTSGRLSSSVDGAPAWTKQKLEDINANEETTKSAEEIPADAANSKPSITLASWQERGVSGVNSFFKF